MRRRSVVLFAIAVAGILLALSFSVYWVNRTATVTGTVDNKAICGTRYDTAYTLAVMGPDGLSTYLPETSSLFAGMNSSSLVTEELIAHIRGTGFEPYYVCGIRLTTLDPVNRLYPGQTPGYIIGLDGFNKLSLNQNVTFDVSYNEIWTVHFVH
ncbi:MAG: hypothetical protein LUO79_05035 [Methanomassiliicoccales archaeon]|nr:hypothetical protein [Methanomassiliicoccales archaeon]